MDEKMKELFNNDWMCAYFRSLCNALYRDGFLIKLIEDHGMDYVLELVIDATIQEYERTKGLA